MAKSFSARMRDRFQRITTNAEKLNIYIHETAMMIASHAKEHGDCSIANNLVMAMPASHRRSMLIAWFAKYTPIVVKDDPNWVAKMHKEGTKLFVPFNLEEGNLEPFYKIAEMVPEKAPLDLAALIAMIKKMGPRIQKDIENGRIVSTDVDAALALSKQIADFHFVAPKQLGEDKPLFNDNAQPKEEGVAA